MTLWLMLFVPLQITITEQDDKKEYNLYIFKFNGIY